MATREVSTVDERFLVSGDEAGTAPGDRRYRPDVEGLRAVAVLLVVLYHAGIPRLTGGYVGVDVFFVISGFVITGLLLRERAVSGRTSILDFYARRCRRILPAATLVILVTVLGTYLALGVVSGNSAADDGRWAAAFLSNFHFEAIGTNYFSASRPPSPLQNYWSLSVEEQFYVVYPTLFLLLARAKGRLSLRVRLSLALGIVIALSYGLSIFQTASAPTMAYFSPFTRAWELALGALVAVSTAWLKQIPEQVAAVLTWVGLALILCAAFVFTPNTTYPGALVAVPVIGAGMIIVGGVVVPRAGVESLLGLRGAGWLGKRSYSLYLWHWPILIIVAEHARGKSVPLSENLLLVLAAVLLSMVTYSLVENPIRHWRLPSRASVTAGLLTVLGTVVFLSYWISVNTSQAAGRPIVPASSTQVLLDQVAASAAIQSIPSQLQPTVANAAYDWGGDAEPDSCQAGLTQSNERICVLGDTHGKQLMVVYGDSHAIMWLPALDGLTKAAHWRLVVLGKPDCPAELAIVANPPGIGSPGRPYQACTQWHTWAIRKINQLHPTMVVVTSENLRVHAHVHRPRIGSFTSVQWRQALTLTLNRITPRAKKVFLGDIPLLSDSGPSCLSTHPRGVQACSTALADAIPFADAVEKSVADELHVQYIDPTPWFCSATCTAIVGNYTVYLDQKHVTATYAMYLQNVLGQALDVLPRTK